MGWVRPTSHDDPYDAWGDEENAYDGDVGTRASPTTLDEGDNAYQLYLTLPPVQSTEVRAFIWLPTPKSKYLIIAFAGEDFVSSLWLPGGSGGDWYTLTFDAMDVDRVMVRTGPRDGFKDYGGVSDCIIRTECGGPLEPFCNVLYEVGGFFTDLANDIADTFAVGPALSKPFVSVGGFFDDLGDKCCEFSLWLEETLGALEGGLTPESLLALIEDYWPGLYGLITDPVGWFLVQLTLAFDLEPWHTQSLEFLAKWILEEYFPTLYAIWLDPEAWIEEHVLSLFPDLPGWFDDAASWLATMLVEHFPALYALWLDPEDWLATLLEDRFPLLYYLAMDPEGEVRYLVGQWFSFEPYQVNSWDLIFKAIMERFFPTLWELYLDPNAWIEEHVTGTIEKLWETLQEALDALQGQLEGILEFLENPGAWVWSRFETWVKDWILTDDELQSLVTDLQMSDIETIFDEMLPDLDEAWKEIEKEMFEEDEIYLPLIQKA